jgi:hypothetical protein
MPSPTTAVAAVAAAATSLSTQTTKAFNHNLAPQPPRVLYRLAAVVCHYGQHSFGHYVCYRRRPRGSGRVGPPRLNDGFHAAPGRGWLRASDDAVREVGIETVLQEGSGAFMLYYERVRDEDKPSVPVWSSHSRAATTTTDDNDDNDDDLGEIDDDDSGLENARTHHRSQQQDVVKCESGLEVDDEMEEVPVIKARVVRSVSLGAGDDFEGALVSVKGERERDGDEGSDSEVRLSRSRPSSRTPAKPEHVEVEPTVTLLPTLSVSTEASSPSPIPDAPAVDEPPIGAPQSVGLRA